MKDKRKHLDVFNIILLAALVGILILCAPTSAKADTVLCNTFNNVTVCTEYNS